MSTGTTRNQPNHSYGFRIPEINSGRYFHPPSRTKRLRNRASLKSAPEKILLLFHPKTSAPAYRSRLGEPLWVATHEPYSPPPFIGALFLFGLFGIFDQTSTPGMNRACLIEFPEIERLRSIKKKGKPPATKVPCSSTRNVLYWPTAAQQGGGAL